MSRRDPLAAAVGIAMAVLLGLVAWGLLALIVAASVAML